MAKVDTLPYYLRPLMEGDTVRTPYCVVCGKSAPLNQHHVVKRSAGKLYRNGVELPKPTLTLCGSGNVSGCHGDAHAGRLHFRWVTASVPIGEVYSPHPVTTKGGHWEWIYTEPMKELKAQGLTEGWKPLFKI